MKFRLLLQNPLLNSSDYKNISCEYIQETLSSPFNLPKLTTKPFIFSCFALSVDGNICYPDLKSGFSIAKNNYQAKKEERLADWWCLSLARAISDAIVIGSNSLLQEKNNYQAEIDIPELINFRQKLNKARSPLYIIITRDINKINFTQELICRDEKTKLLIYSSTSPLVTIKNFKETTLQELTLDFPKQIIISPKLNIFDLIIKLYSLGVATILNESPYYHHELQQLKLLDEAWLNTSGIYIGGPVASLGQMNKPFTSLKHPHYSILSLYNIAYNFLYARYKIDYANSH